MVETIDNEQFESDFYKNDISNVIKAKEEAGLDATKDKARLKDANRRQKSRNEKNELLVSAHKTWPSMFEIYRDKGGPVPPELRGMFTGILEANKAITKQQN